jgi:metal transporter CNNM
MGSVGLSLIMEDISNGFIAFAITTVLTVVVGEIIPQSICTRHGLAIGATMWWFALQKLLFIKENFRLIMVFMIILAPIVFPLGFFHIIFFVLNYFRFFVGLCFG